MSKGAKYIFLNRHSSGFKFLTEIRTTPQMLALIFFYVNDIIKLVRQWKHTQSQSEHSKVGFTFLYIPK